jgi:hypothetical protein
MSQTSVSDEPVLYIAAQLAGNSCQILPKKQKAWRRALVLRIGRIEGQFLSQIPAPQSKPYSIHTAQFQL